MAKKKRNSGTGYKSHSGANYNAPQTNQSPIKRLINYYANRPAMFFGILAFSFLLFYAATNG